MTGRRFFNVTTIDAEGSPTITQVWVDNFASAQVELIARAKPRKNQAPLIQALIFDTFTKQLRNYKIVNGVVTEVAL